MKEKKNKPRKDNYVDDGHTIYDMSGLCGRGIDTDPDNRDGIGLTKKEKRAAIRAAYLKYLPAVLATAVGFGLTMLLIYFWLH